MPSSPFHKDCTTQPWLLEHPAVQLEPMPLVTHEGRELGRSWILRDDLLHPWANGNKLRKLDGYLPDLLARGITDILTCGGVQSAHLAATSCLGAERGVRVHALCRGERPAWPTGNFAITLMYAASMTYVSRDRYADRAQMFAQALETLTTRLPQQATIEVMAEGGKSELAMRGFDRLVGALTEALPCPDEPWELVIDAGTGVSTAGLVKAILDRELPWRVRAVMLLGNRRESYEQTMEELLGGLEPSQQLLHRLLSWQKRAPSRRFGTVKQVDIERCQQIARHTGILFDPIYTLASYESLCQQPRTQDARTLLLHTGGALNLFGALSRRPDALNDAHFMT